jgi:hypothetical protein
MLNRILDLLALVIAGLVFAATAVGFFLMTVELIGLSDTICAYSLLAALVFSVWRVTREGFMQC